MHLLERVRESEKLPSRGDGYTAVLSSFALRILVMHTLTPGVILFFFFKK